MKSPMDAHSQLQYRWHRQEQSQTQHRCQPEYRHHFEERDCGRREDARWRRSDLCDADVGEGLVRNGVHQTGDQH